MTKSAQENCYNNQQKKHDSCMAVLSRNQSERAVNSTDKPYSGTRQYSIKRETEIKCEKNLDTTASCEMTENNTGIQPSGLEIDRQERQKPTVRRKPPDIPRTSTIDKTSSLPDKFQKNVDEN